MPLPIAIRPATENDRPLIAHTLRHIDKLIVIDSMQWFWVCCDSTEPNTVYGFLWAPQRRFVGYLFVKQAFRELGIARRLMDYVFMVRCQYGISGIQMPSVSRKTAAALKALKITPSPLAWASCEVANNAYSSSVY